MFGPSSVDIVAVGGSGAYVAMFPTSETSTGIITLGSNIIAPNSAAVADIDRDGVPDVIVAGELLRCVDLGWVCAHLSVYGGCRDSCRAVPLLRERRSGCELWPTEWVWV